MTPPPNSPRSSGRKETDWRHFANWPLRAKLATLFILVSLGPLTVAAMIDIQQAREQGLRDAGFLLAARADQLAGELDMFNQGYSRSVERLARLPEVVAFSNGLTTGATSPISAMRATLGVWPASDAQVRGVALLDPEGIVVVGSEPQLEGRSLAFHSYVMEGLRGKSLISDVHAAEVEVERVPTIAYVAPVLAADRSVSGLAVIWVRATALWNLAKASNGLAGANSFAVIFDEHGIRIAHTYSDDIVFHPAGKLDSTTLESAIAEASFGERTRDLLNDVREFPEQFDRARSPDPDRSIFRGRAPVNEKWNYGVGRRLQRAPWTLFYMVPDESLEGPLADMKRHKTGLAGAIILFALAAGALFATTILRPLRSLSDATKSLGEGDLTTRVSVRSGDEIGLLGTSFNAMASRIEEQDAALRKERGALEQRVSERTAELQKSEESLSITLDSIGDAVIATDALGQVVRMNAVAEKLTGWSFDDARGHSLGEVFNIVNEDTRAPVESPVERVLREGVVVGLANHTALIARDGSECAIADSGAPIRNARGDLVGVVLVFRDQTEERRAERALQQSEARKTAVMEAALDSIVVMDHNGLIREFNAAAEKTFGYARAQVLGKSLADLLVPNALREQHRAGLARFLESGEGPILGRRVEVSALRSDGAEFPAEVAVVRIKTDGPPLFTGYIRDITERKRAADALLASEARFRRLSESGVLGIITADIHGNILEANDAFLKMVQYSREEVLSRKVGWADMTPPEWRHLDLRAIEQLKASGVATAWEKEYSRKDGSRIPILVGVAMLDGTQGECIAFILDLTEQKRAERALRALEEQRESDARFRALLEAAPDAMVIVDQEGRIVLVNAQTERLFGYPREELLGQPVDGLVPDLDRTAGAPGPGLELVGHHKDGRRFPIELSSSPLETKDGVLLSTAIRDTTERKRAEEELRRAKGVAETASRELEAFSYSVAHDLRAPLRAINGYSSSLVEDLGEKLDDDSKNSLERISAAAARMGHLIDALLRLARVSRMELVRRPVDMTQIARSVIAHLQASEPSRTVDVVIREDLVSTGDAQLIRSLLDNLLGNAWKFTLKTSNPKLELGVEESRDTKVYFVRDNGAGFDMADAGRLFTPFQRLHAAKEFAGSGIGLATAQRIVRRHGGRIWVEAIPNEGAVFRFTLSEEGLERSDDGGSQFPNRRQRPSQPPTASG